MWQIFYIQAHQLADDRGEREAPRERLAHEATRIQSPSGPRFGGLRRGGAIVAAGDRPPTRRVRRARGAARLRRPRRRRRLTVGPPPEPHPRRPRLEAGPGSPNRTGFGMSGTRSSAVRAGLA